MGAMNAFTDLGGRKGLGKKFVKDFNFKNTEFCGSMFFSAVYKNEFALRIEGTFGQIHAYDSILKSVAQQLMAVTNEILVSVAIFQK